MLVNGFNVLSENEVLSIHEILVTDFANSKDPISPSGVREKGALLSSAVSRQLVGYEGDLKYHYPISNAASLCFGVCCNHPFHNGNKRTALVALLCHLDKNGFTFKEGVTQNDLYKLMIRIASHGFSKDKSKSDTSDEEIQGLVQWLNKNTRQFRKGEKTITFRKLEQILRNHDVYLENPQGNFVDVVQYKIVKMFPWSKGERKGERKAKIPYPKKGMDVGKKVIKTIREKCGLTELDGFDTELFYKGETDIDVFIAKYRKTLDRLAQT